KKIEKENGRINYNLTTLVDTIQNSIINTGKVIIPKDVTEFEKSLLIARRIQHNDSQLVAIKMFKILLKFKLYRTKGEELYLKLLISNSLDYLGAPHIAYHYTLDVFPDIFKEIKDPEISGLIRRHQAGLLIRIKKINEAKNIYKNNLILFSQNNNEVESYTTRNNLAYAYFLSKELDSAKMLFKVNQNPKFQSLKPILYAFAYGNYGLVLKKEGNYDSSLIYLRKEINLLNEINQTEGIHIAYFGLGELFELQGEIDSANYFYLKSIKATKETKHIPLIIKNYENLIRLYATEQNAPELSNFIDLYIGYNDSLKSILKLQTLQNELRIFQFLNILKETTDSKELNDQLKINNRELLYISLILALLVVLLIIIITIRTKNRLKLKEKNNELKGKNIELKDSYLAISVSNKKNEILLKELHHRVKNNLQIISSLFNLQLNANKLDLSTEEVFKDAKNRIHSISLVHKKIYQSDNINSLNFEEYIRDFSDEILKVNPNDINLSIDIKRNPIPIESAIPLGLIFNELFTNSLKHSKQTDLLKISIQYLKVGDKEKFIYTDNGVGVKNIEVMKDNDSSIGVTLIHLLCEQLDCEVNYKEAVENKHGFWLSIEGNFD
ncbi:MAG: hypothetical protein JKY48_03185, partial [Flavobacteriales bacterium]|nr:hypothetical protein [Flavobacteriales bacterium]